MKEQFYSIRTETTVCPLAILVDETKPSSFGDKCVKCALCVESCFANNLEIVEYDQNFEIPNLLELHYNAIALGYLDKITGFAANTNRNRSLNFDGFLQTRAGEPCFVEVDYNNDSLECCRRLIGSFITYEGHIGPIRNGLIVLQEFPKEGSRDVFNVIDKMMTFPTTKECKIYFCTFSLLRHMMLKRNTFNLALAELFYNPREESLMDYLRRITEEKQIDLGQVQSLDCINEEKQILSGYDQVPTIPLYDEYHEGCIPLYTMRAACSALEINEDSYNEEPEIEAWVDVSGHGFTPNKDRYFAVHAKGNSMLPKIEDGDICIFEWYNNDRGGTRNGEIVLIYAEDVKYADDWEFTIKEYHSEIVQDEDGWQHKKIDLIPLNPDYNIIELSEEQQPRTIGVLKCVL
jgi:SOS-response transcriptional repressor LexA